MQNSRIVITGNLKQVSLFDLVNFLKSTAKTGVLTLVNGDGRGYFHFKQGQIINIVDEAFAQGEHLALKYFRWQDGNFEFSQAEVDEASRIKKDTDTLLFDIARSLDEELRQPAAPQQPAPPEEPAGDGMEQLRDIFSKAIKRSKDGGVQPRHIDIHDVVKIIRDSRAHDLTIRAGRPPLARKDGEGLVPVGAPLSGIDVVRMLDQIMSKENYADLLEKDYFRQKTFETASGDLEFLVVRDMQGYTITFRLIDKQASKIADAGVTEEQLKTLFDGPGIILVSGADPALRANLFAALVDWLNEKHNAHILLVAERLQWAFKDGSSVITQVVVSDNPGENVAKLRAVLSNAPRFLAYNAAFTPEIFNILLDFCHEGGCVLLSVKGTDVEALARQVSQGAPDKSPREVLIRTRALIYAEGEKSTHVKLMPSDPTSLSRVAQKVRASSEG